MHFPDFSNQFSKFFPAYMKKIEKRPPEMHVFLPYENSGVPKPPPLFSYLDQ